MTKKDYELIAAAFKRAYDPMARSVHANSQDNLAAAELNGMRRMVLVTANALQSDNARFKRDVFLKACGLMDE